MTKEFEISRDIERLKFDFLSAKSEEQQSLCVKEMVKLERRLQFMSIFKGAVKGQGGAPFSLGPSGVQLFVKGLSDWQKARDQNDFSVAVGSLEKLADKTRKKAGKQAKKLGLSSPYEAILDAQTPGLRLHHLEKWAEDLAPFCKNVWRSSMDVQAKDRRNERARPFLLPDLSMPAKDQKKITPSFLHHAGVDIKNVTVNEALHPVCFGTQDDVFIGVSYNQDDVTKTFLDHMHEGGHAWYRQNLPLGQAIAGAGIDEAMALIFENHIGRDKSGAFLLHFDLEIASVIDGKEGYEAPSLRQLYQHMTEIDPSVPRKDADEVRYPLDIILRYRLEKMLFDEGRKVEELPGLWEREYEALTGIKVENDCDGVLQDPHWSAGAFGWFPNYLFGTLAAAQLFDAACKEKPMIREEAYRAETGRLEAWLQEKIVRHGSSMNALDLIEQATGKPLGTDAYKAHVWRRYYNKPGYQTSHAPLSPKG